MGEVSKNMVMVLALVVIVVSAIGTWSVMNAAIDIFSGEQVPIASESAVSRGVVRVNVNGGPDAPAYVDESAAPLMGSATGRITVMLKE